MRIGEGSYIPFFAAEHVSLMEAGDVELHDKEAEIAHECVWKVEIRYIVSQTLISL